VIRDHGGNIAGVTVERGGLGASLVALETAALLRELTAGLVGEDLDEALDHLARTSRHALPDVDWASVTLLRAGEPAGGAASDPVARRLDELQYAIDGPAMTAIRDRAVVLGEDLVTEERWPQWTPRAVVRGVRSVLCAPVDVDDEVLACISMYARVPGGLGADAQLTAMLLAEHAGLLLAAVRDRARRAAVPGDVAGTLASGEVIGQAIGVVMVQRRCPAPEALDVLRGASAALSIPIADVARRLVGSATDRASATS
jgi:GAF domain-containing protein